MPAGAHSHRRRPLPPPVTDEAEIERLVRAFYARIRADIELAPLFEPVIGPDWEPHLRKMCAFWSSVMLTSGRYKGAPMQAHLRLPGLRPAHFARWLALFRETADSICVPAVADAFMARAVRIAGSIEAAMFLSAPFTVSEPE